MDFEIDWISISCCVRSDRSELNTINTTIFADLSLLLPWTDGLRVNALCPERLEIQR